MGARKIDMHRLQEMVRLLRMGRSARQIAQRLRMGRDTIRAYRRGLKKAGVLDGEPDDLPDVGQLQTLVSEHVPSKELMPAVSSVERWRPDISRLRRDNGAGPTAIHDWLRSHHPDYEGSLSAVKRMCQRLTREEGPKPTDVAIPVVTAPGEIAQVDFVYAGKMFDPEQGKERKTWLFLMSLGFSRHMFCQLVFDQKIETWLRLHIEAFEFFGGVPRVIVPDNLKAAVIRAAFDVTQESELNRSYCELARHYGFQIDPTPPRSPQKKGKVERDGRYVKGNFLKTCDAADIHEARRELRQWVDQIASRRRHGTTGRPPIDLFLEREKDALLPLPRTRWQPIIWTKVKVHTNSHVHVDGAFYSAPWRLLHKELWVRVTATAVVLYHNDELLWTHRRGVLGEWVTHGDHLPEHRRELRHRSLDYWIEQAELIGSEVRELVCAMHDAADVKLPLRKIQAIVLLLAKFPEDRARRAAKRATHFGSLDYVSIKSMLDKALDLEPLGDEVQPREWSRGSRFARSPTEPVLSSKEKIHGLPG